MSQCLGTFSGTLECSDVDAYTCEPSQIVTADIHHGGGERKKEYKAFTDDRTMRDEKELIRLLLRQNRLFQV